MTHRTYMLASLPPGAADLVGAKALSLARLTYMGLPCPPAAVVTTLAYWEHLARLHEGAAASSAVRRLPARNDGSDQDPIAHLCLDPDLTAELRGLYSSLGGGPMAVRASPTPDYSGSSDPTVHGAFFRTDFGGSMAAMVEWWMSLRSTPAPRATAVQGVDYDAAAMAVVIQPLVFAECSGVVFSADPATLDPAQVIIASTFGLGRGVFSEGAFPDHYVFCRDGLELVDMSIGRKDTEVVVGLDGLVYEWQTEAGRSLSASLGPSTARDLARLALMAAEGFNTDVAVEWALEDGRPYLLDVHPLTTASRMAASGPTRRKLSTSVS